MERIYVEIVFSEDVTGFTDTPNDADGKIEIVIPENVANRQDDSTTTDVDESTLQNYAYTRTTYVDKGAPTLTLSPKSGGTAAE